MERLQIRPYEQPDEEGVIRLWRDVFPDAPSHNDPAQDIRQKLEIQPELFFVALIQDQLVGTAMTGYDGHRGWVYYVAVHPDLRRRGIGSTLMRQVEESLLELGCSKINLQIRSNNSTVRSFYESLGYEIEDRISMARRLKT